MPGDDEIKNKVVRLLATAKPKITARRKRSPQGNVVYVNVVYVNVVYVSTGGEANIAGGSITNIRA